MSKRSAKVIVPVMVSLIGGAAILFSNGQQFTRVVLITGFMVGLVEPG